ncbi:uncharacterized protein LOC124363429 [Homalodisca vitripennis]|uniref:uncharacterized protein LOC124363429 n=1 Tax=Homalodisca vitripennis TaxID=197043 RepID=UPI001EEAFE53|nr:uncharacterized protein LOC124363429 [Homalodisca vitripennis]
MELSVSFIGHLVRRPVVARDSRSRWATRCQRLARPDSVHPGTADRYPGLTNLPPQEPKNKKDSKESGAGASKLRKYIYHEALQFLEKVRVHAETTSNIQGEGQQDDTVDESGVDSQNTQQTTNTVPNTVYKPSNVAPKKKKKMDDFELRMLKVVETPQQDGDRHLSFFKGIIPSISKFSEPQIVEFQLGVLQLVQKMQQTTPPTQVPHNIVHYQQPLSIQVQQQQLFDQQQQYMPMHQPNTGCNTNRYAALAQQPCSSTMVTQYHQQLQEQAKLVPPIYNKLYNRLGLVRPNQI